MPTCGSQFDNWQLCRNRIVQLYDGYRQDTSLITKLILFELFITSEAKITSPVNCHLDNFHFKLHHTKLLLAYLNLIFIIQGWINIPQMIPPFKLDFNNTFVLTPICYEIQVIICMGRNLLDYIHIFIPLLMRIELIRLVVWSILTYIIYAKVALSVCLSVLFSRSNRCTDFKEIRYRDTLILEEKHRLFFAVIIDKHAGGAVCKSYFSI